MAKSSGTIILRRSGSRVGSESPSAPSSGGSFSPGLDDDDRQQIQHGPLSPVISSSCEIIAESHYDGGAAEEGGDNGEGFADDGYRKDSKSGRTERQQGEERGSRLALPVLVLVLAQFIYSGWHVLGSRILNDVPYVTPIDFSIVRGTLTCTLLSILARIKERGKDGGAVRPPRVGTSDFYKTIVAGVCGGCVMPVLYLRGLIMTSPTVTSCYEPMLPVMVFGATVALGIERIHTPVVQIGSLGLAVGGSILVLLGDFHHHREKHADTPDARDKHREFLLGNVFLIGMLACYAIMTLMQRELKQYPPLSLTSWIFGVGAMANCAVVVLTPGLSLWSVASETIRAISESNTFAVGLAYCVVALSALNFSAVSYASRHLESSIVTLFMAAQPPITVLLEALIFSKPVGVKKKVGMVMVVWGMCYFTKTKSNGDDGVERAVLDRKGASPWKGIVPSIV